MEDIGVDGVGQGRVTQVLMPLVGVILRAEDGGCHLVMYLYQFQYIPSLCLFERVQQLFV